MTYQRKTVDCPMCLFSSGYRPFVGATTQKCESCNGTGKITKTAYNTLMGELGDLIPKLKPINQFNHK